MASRVVAVFISASLAIGAAHAATIAGVISPTAIVLTSASARAVASIEGAPVLYCGLPAFNAWAAPLVGQPVQGGAADGMTVSLGSREVPLDRLFVERGWLRPAVLDDVAQAAITEGRGGWACANAVVPFALMHTSVDPRVLAGIALNESGVNGRAWPWTLNVAGRGYFFRSREDAYGAIRELLAAGRDDFDVGIMQVNWHYHRQRFASPWDALAPATNIRVAEAILNENYQRTHSAAKAIAWYHSANPVPGGAYLARFARHLNQIHAAP
ncbi:transglycosylase SLT domain-containing protein [Paraburkholderia unamae]|uniref:Transglycosylase-like protein with SLT domain n=1 Tax=Paraburkholderia unamae TaxID=219649 RepID=A0ABX5KST8_9BURK|nr:transglycosylase SLT domain-containing protein [Paraburkholderia unamae]PVX85836.1 transglycosylase-like protein with SLT domain [Paraburkholderia unamae]